MSCQPIDLRMIRGMNKTFRITVSSVSSGDRRVLTTDTVHFVVKESLSDTALLIDKDSSVPAEITILDQDDYPGMAEIYLVPADTEDLDAVPHYYEVQIESSGGDFFSVAGPAKLYIEQSVNEVTVP
jgi:hypothetical protein